MSDNIKPDETYEHQYNLSDKHFYYIVGEKLASMRALASNDLEEVTEIDDALIDEEAKMSMMYHHNFFRDLHELKQMIEKDAQNVGDTEEKEKNNSESQDMNPVNPTTIHQDIDNN